MDTKLETTKRNINVSGWNRAACMHGETSPWKKVSWALMPHVLPPARSTQMPTLASRCQLLWTCLTCYGSSHVKRKMSTNQWDQFLPWFCSGDYLFSIWTRFPRLRGLIVAFWSGPLVIRARASQTASLPTDALWIANIPVAPFAM